MKRVNRYKTAVLTASTALLIATAPASAEQPPSVQFLGNNGCLLVFDKSVHVNPGEMFRYIRAHSDQFVGESAQNIVQWLANFPNYQGTVGDLVRRNCRTFVVNIS